MAFATRMSAALGVSVEAAETAEQAVADADVVILATNSSTPVIEPSWLRPGAHINTLGPKKKPAHELPLDIAEGAARIASDSPQQIAAMGDDHVLHGHAASARIMHLGDPKVLEKRGPGFSLFLSSGLAGSEVAALAAVLKHLDGASA